jgi:hypothetical protein
MSKKVHIAFLYMKYSFSPQHEIIPFMFYILVTAKSFQIGITYVINAQHVATFDFISPNHTSCVLANHDHSNIVGINEMYLN